MLPDPIRQRSSLRKRSGSSLYRQPGGSCSWAALHWRLYTLYHYHERWVDGEVKEEMDQLQRVATAQELLPVLFTGPWLHSLSLLR